jgi:hypothetical protein
LIFEKQNISKDSSFSCTKKKKKRALGEKYFLKILAFLKDIICAEADMVLR